MIKNLDDPILDLIFYSTPVGQLSMIGYAKNSLDGQKTAYLKLPPYVLAPC